MAGIPNSPAVVFLEKDNSAYPPNVDSSIVGLVGYASKGPTDEATLITSQEQLLTVFGSPRETIVGQGLEGALEILESTNQIYFVRPSPANALEASAQIQYGVCPAVLFAPSGFGVTQNLHLIVTLKDAEGVSILESQEFSILSSVDNSGISQASSVAKILGTGNTPTDHFHMAWNTATQTQGYLISNYAGNDAIMTIASYSEAGGVSPISALQQLQLSSGVTATALFTSSLTISGIDVDLSSLNYFVKSLYDGDGYNLSSDSNTGQTLGVSIEVDTGGGAYSVLTVNSEGIAAESYKVSLLNDSTFVETAINIGVDNAISDFIKGEIYHSGTSLDGTTPLNINELDSISTLGTFISGINLTNGAGVRALNVTPKFLKLIDGTYGLAGGSIGTMDSSSTLIGNASAKTGIYTLDDDTLNISMAAVPGIFDQRVQNALISLAESTQSFIAVVSPPVGLDTTQEAVNWMNGKGDGRTAAINSSWAAVYWPWVQVFDTFSSKDRWYDPVIFAIRQMVFTDQVSEPWFAPAGFRRGRLTKPTSVEIALNQGDRDSLYVTNINPIVNFSPEGITIFGQKTAQRATTSLDRVNVRRLMIFLRKVLLSTGRQDLFEPNDLFTWELIKDKAEALLSDIQSRRGIVEFRVICDETVNTPIRVDRNELWCKILLQPTKTAEWIIFEVNLTNQSAKFSG